MTAPAYLSQSSVVSFSSANGPTALSKPPGVADGHFMLLVWGLGYTNSATSSQSYPAGWTTLLEYNATPSNAGIALAYRVASGEGSSFTVQQNTAAAVADRALIIAWSGAAASPIDVQSSISDQPATASPAAPSVTTTGTDRLLITACLEYSGANRTIAPPGSMTDRWQWTSVPSLDVCEEVVAAAGATGTRTFSVTPSAAYFKTFSFALAPAGGGGGGGGGLVIPSRKLIRLRRYLGG